MTEAEFHGKRQMWADKYGHFVLAPRGYPYPHFDWFCGLFGLEQARELGKSAPIIMPWSFTRRPG